MAKVLFWDEAQKDYGKLDGHSKAWVDVAVYRLAQRGSQIGKPLINTNYAKLAGFRELKYQKLGIRLIYKVQINGQIEIIEIVAIGSREDEKVFRVAEQRRRKRR